MAIAAVCLTYTRRATAMKCAQTAKSLRVGVKTGLGEAIRMISCELDDQLM
jgi:hypothetical protein